MLILLAESKTMSAHQYPVEPAKYAEHTPVVESTADEIMAKMESMTPGEISEALGISNGLAVKAHNLAYDFPHKLSGYKPLEAFTGEAFRSLEASTLSPEALERAAVSLKFISSVYGLLSAEDIIKPYRNEFNKALDPSLGTPIQIFKPKVTIALAKIIKENGVKDVINLLPADADKCIDWKIIRSFTKVHRMVFQTIGPSGKLKTPIAGRLKALRGTMARTILSENLQTFSDLTNFESPDFFFSPTHSKPLLPVFLSAE